MFEISPLAAKYIASPSLIHSPIPTLPADEVQGTQASLLSHEEGASSSHIPPCYLEAGYSVSLSLPIRSKMPSRQLPFNFSTATHTQTKKYYLLTMFLYGVDKTVSVTDEPSTSTIRFHYTEMLYQLVSWDSVLLFLTE